MSHKSYDRWVEEYRKVYPPANLAEEIMSQVTEVENQRRHSIGLRAAHRIEQSRVARWAVYCGTLAIGSIPFIFLAHVSRL